VQKLKKIVGEIHTDYRTLMAGTIWQKAIGITGLIIFWFPGGGLVIVPVYISYKVISKKRR
jgi:hypothetical protein